MTFITLKKKRICISVDGKHRASFRASEQEKAAKWWAKAKPRTPIMCASCMDFPAEQGFPRSFDAHQWIHDVQMRALREVRRMIHVRAPAPAPTSYTKSIFLAGPSPRSPSDPHWRPEAIQLLLELGYDGVVFDPTGEGDFSHGYDAQVEWERKHLEMADVVVFWVPRSEELPGFTTNVEFGMLYDSGKAVLGFPEGAMKMSYLEHHAKLEGVPVCSTLEDTLKVAIERVGAGAWRQGGDRLPLHIWALPQFRQWYLAQIAARNRLDGARPLWNFRVGPNKDKTFAAAVHVDMYIQAERRNKANEFIFMRPDCAAVVAYRRPRGEGDGLMGTEVVLIREFRSCASTVDGYIHELPGGSSNKAMPAVDVAAHELKEETGLSIATTRLRLVGTEQVCGTLSTHRVTLFAVELTEEEMASMRAEAASGRPHGVVADTERTYVEVETVERLFNRRRPAHRGPCYVDWSNLGMILKALTT